MDLSGLVDKVKELQGRNETLSRQLERSGREHSEQRAALRDLCARQEAEIGRLITEVGSATRERADLRAEVARLRSRSPGEAEEGAAEAPRAAKSEVTTDDSGMTEDADLPDATPANSLAVVALLSPSCPDLRGLLQPEADRNGCAGDLDVFACDSCTPGRRLSLQPLPETGCRKAAEDDAAATAAEASVGKQIASLPATTEAVTPCSQCASLEAEASALRRDLAARDARLAELSDALESLDSNCRRSDAAHAEKLDDLGKQLAEASARVARLHEQLDRCKSGLGDQLACLIRDRDQLQEGLNQLQGWYDALLSARRESADDMRQNLLEGIPAAADELQVLVLKLKEDLIAERVNREQLEKRYQSEAAFQRQKLLSESERLRQTEECLQSETEKCNHLQSELGRERSAREAAQTQLAALQEKSREVAANLRASEAELKVRVTRLEADNAELRHRVACLQTELHNSESVQKDFVELSQSLQVQLENLRQQESQVRWQFLEDVQTCGACGRALSLALRPRRCLHCVRIFCHDCTAKTVQSGPKQRVANVCEFCHTLVVKDAVPYFSVRAPAAGGKK